MRRSNGAGRARYERTVSLPVTILDRYQRQNNKTFDDPVPGAAVSPGSSRGRRLLPAGPSQRRARCHRRGTGMARPPIPSVRNAEDGANRQAPRGAGRDETVPATGRVQLSGQALLLQYARLWQADRRRQRGTATSTAAASQDPRCCRQQCGHSAGSRYRGWLGNQHAQHVLGHRAAGQAVPGNRSGGGAQAHHLGMPRHLLTAQRT